MDGENKGKPYFLMGWFGGDFPTIFGNTHIPGSSTYVKFLPFGSFFWWKGTNFTHLEDPGIYTHTITYIYSIYSTVNIDYAIMSKMYIDVRDYNMLYSNIFLESILDNQSVIVRSP